MTGTGKIDDWDDPDLAGYSFVYSGFSKKSAGGVAVICNPDVKILLIVTALVGADKESICTKVGNLHIPVGDWFQLAVLIVGEGMTAH